MSNFKTANYNQDTMIVVNFLDQIEQDRFAYTLHYLIDEEIDLSAFHEHYKNASVGRKAYDPAVMLKIILYAYYKGVKSSRDIQWSCEHNIMFKALSCDSVPHWTGIAKFISGYQDAIESVFEQVLLSCDQRDLIGHELIAIDGCKMSSDASKEYSGTLDELGQKRDKIKRQMRACMEEHKQLDKRKAREKERKEQLEQKRDTLRKEFKKIDDFLKTAEPRMGKAKQQKEVKSNITDNESAKITTSKGTIQGFNGIAAVDKKHQIIVDAQAFGEASEHHTLQPIIESIRQRYRTLGIGSDLHGGRTVVTADTGFSNDENNRYLKDNKVNAYVPDLKFRERDKYFANQKKKYGKRHQDTKKNQREVIPVSEFTFNEKRKTCRCPAGNEMGLYHERTLKSGAKKYVFEGKLTDCRVCPLKDDCMRNPSSANHRKGHGRQVHFTVDQHKTATAWMKKRVDSRQGKVIYGHRMSVVEPVFANIGTQKQLNRFSLRGKKKVQGQWQLYCLVHNIEKIMNYGT